MPSDKVIVNQISEASLERLCKFAEDRNREGVSIPVEAEHIIPVRMQDGDRQMNYLSKLPRRFGRFRVMFELLCTASQENIDEIFKGIRILEAKVDIFTGAVEYHAWCEDFELLDTYEMPPMYYLNFKMTDDKLEREIGRDGTEV